jgi:hypothetical protein
VQSQRSASDGSFGWSDSTLWVDEGLRARFAVTLQRDALPGSRPPLELRYRMVADGPVKVLQVMPAPSAAASGEVPSLPVLASEEDDGKLRLSVHVSLACLGVSLIADGCEELLYLSLVDPVVSYRASSGRDFLSAQVRHLQVDNQLQAASFPVLLQPSFSAEEAQQAVRPHSLELLVQRRIGAAQVPSHDTARETARDSPRPPEMARDGERPPETARDGARRRETARETARDGARRREMARDGARWREMATRAGARRLVAALARCCTTRPSRSGCRRSS